MFEKAIAAFNHANLLLQQGRLDEAVSAYRNAIELHPAFADAYNNLGVALRRQGKLDEALDCHGRALALVPGHVDALINCGQLLFRRAQLGLVPIPKSAPPSFLEPLYNRRSLDWDQSAAHLKKYCAPQLVAAELLARVGASKKPDVLDAGCGSGLVGELIRPIAATLHGVDLSPGMLEKARTKHIYDMLFHDDLVNLMAARPRSYDVVTCAATLIHFGDLRTVFEAASDTLKNGGIFIFTLFPLHDLNVEYAITPIDALRLMGCFAHSESYVIRTANGTNFDIEKLSHETHEYMDERPVSGLLGIARRRPR